MDWMLHVIILLTALVHTVTCQVVELAKCYSCASARSTDSRRYLAQVSSDYTSLGYREFDEPLAPCGDPFSRGAGSVRLCDNGYGCLKTRMELPNNQVVILRGCARYSVCQNGRVSNAPTPRGNVRVTNTCCQNAYCNHSTTTKYNLVILAISVSAAVLHLLT